MAWKCVVTSWVSQNGLRVQELWPLIHRVAVKEAKMSYQNMGTFYMIGFPHSSNLSFRKINSNEVEVPFSHQTRVRSGGY